MEKTKIKTVYSVMISERDFNEYKALVVQGKGDYVAGQLLGRMLKGESTSPDIEE